MSKKVERMKNPVKSGGVSVRHVWSMDGEKLSLSQAADYCDATYSPMHYAWKMAVKDGRTRFVCKGVEFSTEPVEPRVVESKKGERKAWTRGMALLPGLCTHRLG